MDELTKGQINSEIQLIDKSLKETELIFDLVKVEEPDLVYKLALGSILHSFYNGIENIFTIIAKQVDNSFPTGNNNHHELLDQMASENAKRREVINENLYFKLREYLGFRHVFRHSYDFQLLWEKMKPLVDNVLDIWSETKESINKFIKEQELRNTIYENKNGTLDMDTGEFIPENPPIIRTEDYMDYNQVSSEAEDEDEPDM